MDTTTLTPVTLQTSTWTHPVIKGFKLPERWNDYYHYEPKPDITSYEVSMIMKLFYPAGMYIDPKEFIDEHKLNRHFVEISRP